MKATAVVQGLLLVLAAVSASAQEVDINQKITQMSSLGKSDPEYRLGPGDLIEVGVFGVEKFTQTLRINASGLLKLPLIEPVKATGLTAAELERKLATLLDGEVIKNPQVSVFIKEYRSQPVFVLGAVNHPGQYQITQPLKLVDLLSMAGGLLPTASDEALLQRRIEPPPGESESAEPATAKQETAKQETVKINLQQLLEKGDLSLNIPVRGGDVLQIQARPAQLVYVIGEVNRAGVFPLPEKRDLRVSQAFAYAGGPMRTAKLSEGILVRYDEKGERKQVAVDFGQILKGKAEDFLVRPDDVIFVPGSKAKNVGYGLLQIVPSTLTAAIYHW